MKNSRLKISTWKEIREEVKKVNPLLAHAISQLRGSSKLKLCKIEYPFGMPVFQQGVLVVPAANNSFLPITDPEVVTYYREYLGTDKLMPFGMILQNTLSNSCEGEVYDLPAALFYPGQIFGLRELFGSVHSFLQPNHWNLYAGARAIFAATTIFTRAHYRLLAQKFGLQTRFPLQLMDHFFLFRELLHHPAVNSNWTTTILLLPKSVQDSFIKKNIWVSLQKFFIKHVWEQAVGWRFDIVADRVWHQIMAEVKKDFTFSWTQAEILKQIVRIALGYAPCFVPYDPEEVTAPLSLLTQLLREECRLAYTPTIMVPTYIAPQGEQSGYYSLSAPSVIAGIPLNQQGRGLLQELRGLQHAWQILREGVDSNRVYVGNHILRELLRKLELNFFAEEETSSANLLGALKLLAEETNLTPGATKDGPDGRWSTIPGAFFRGVIKIEAQEFFVTSATPHREGDNTASALE